MIFRYIQPFIQWIFLWNHLTFRKKLWVFQGAFGERLRPCTLRSSWFNHPTNCWRTLRSNWSNSPKLRSNLDSNSPEIWKNADLSIHQDANQQLFRIDPTKAGESSKKIEGIASKNGKITRHPRKNICWCKLQDQYWTSTFRSPHFDPCLSKSSVSSGVRWFCRVTSNYLFNNIYSRRLYPMSWVEQVRNFADHFRQIIIAHIPPPPLITCWNPINLA